MKTNTLILKLTNMVLATANNHTDEITATISSGNPFFTVHELSSSRGGYFLIRG